MIVVAQKRGVGLVSVLDMLVVGSWVACLCHSGVMCVWCVTVGCVTVGCVCGVCVCGV